MKIITAPELYIPEDHHVSCFLAGGITNCPDWQHEVIKQLYDLTLGSFEPIIFNPRRENFPIWDKSAAVQQIEWEYEMLERCDIFSMYFSSGDSDQPICMYELGRNILRMQMRHPSDWQDRIVISVEDDYRRRQDVLIQTGLATQDQIMVNTQISPRVCLGDHVDNIERAFKKVVR